MSEQCVAVTFWKGILTYRGCAGDGNGGPAWTDRWATLTYRDGVFGNRPSCIEGAFSDGTRFAGEMSWAFVERRCVRWVQDGVR